MNPLPIIILWGVLPLLTITIVMVFVYLMRSNSLPDKIVAMDLLAAIGMCISAVYAIATEQKVFLDVTTILALISFLGTIAFAYYIDRRA
jgi:multicomponent Na+:H+ antiporter subunit F